MLRSVTEPFNQTFINIGLLYFLVRQFTIIDDTTRQLRNYCYSSGVDLISIISGKLQVHGNDFMIFLSCFFRETTTMTTCLRP